MANLFAEYCSFRKQLPNPPWAVARALLWKWFEVRLDSALLRFVLPSHTKGPPFIAHRLPPLPLVACSCRLSPPSPEVFKYVQVVTAICDALAHGANDINNAVGPFQVMYKVYVTGGIKPLDSPLGLGSGFL